MLKVNFMGVLLSPKHHKEDMGVRHQVFVKGLNCFVFFLPIACLSKTMEGFGANTYKHLGSARGSVSEVDIAGTWTHSHEAR